MKILLLFFALFLQYATYAAESNISTTSAVQIKTFAQVYAIAKQYYVESVTDSTLIRGAIDGLLNNLDPHSDYLSADDLKQLTEITTGSFAGLGIEISREKGSGAIKVIAPIYGTPAYLAGIKSGDLINKIDNLPVSQMPLDEAIKKIRGKPGSTVKLSIIRNNETNINFTIVRQIINIHSVKSTMLTESYGYILITNFQADTSNNLVSALLKMSINQKLKGIVLDLRDNPGGLLQAAVGTASAFLPQNKLVVYTNGRIQGSKQYFYANAKSVNINGTQAASLQSLPLDIKNIPLVVLVNQGSASASEIVAGALQDYKRAKILGMQTFGKGSVQTVIPLSSDTAIKLTTALYYTPNGRSIQAAGISPDIIIKSDSNDVLNDFRLTESVLAKHIDNPQNNLKNVIAVPVISPTKQLTIKELQQRALDNKNQLPHIMNQDIAYTDINNDFQLSWALKILRGDQLPSSTNKMRVSNIGISK